MLGEDKKNENAITLEEKLQRWITQLPVKLASSPENQKNFEIALLELLKQRPWLCEEKEDKPAYINVALESFLADELRPCVLTAIEMLLKVGAYHSNIATLKGFLPSSLNQETFFSPCIIFHILMQPGLAAYSDHHSYTRAVGQYYQKLTDREYVTCYHRLFGKKELPLKEMREAVKEYAITRFGIERPSYQPPEMPVGEPLVSPSSISSMSIETPSPSRRI